MQVEHNPFIIVIGRQYGSGGRAIGKKIADRLAIPYFDKEILTEASRKSGIDSNVFSTADEKKPGILRSFLSSLYGSTIYDTQSAMSPEKIYEAQSRVIKAIAENGPCVIVGRTADYILRDKKNLVSIFIHASEKHRARRLISRSEASETSRAISIALKKDKERSEFYGYFTGRKWGDAANYDLSVDSSAISQDDLVDIILQFLAKKKFKDD